MISEDCLKSKYEDWYPSPLCIYRHELKNGRKIENVSFIGSDFQKFVINIQSSWKGFLGTGNDYWILVKKTTLQMYDLLFGYF